MRMTPPFAWKSWFDWRSALVALVLGIAASFLFLFSSSERRDFYFFEVTLTSTNSGFTQLFWDMGRGITEYDSSSQPLKIEPKPVRYRYMLPSGTISGMRFDLINRHSVMTLTQPRIVNRRGNVIRAFALDEFTVGQQITRFERQGDKLVVETKPEGNDPVLDLKFATPVSLPKDSLTWLIVTAPVLVPVFLLGLIVGSPAVVRLVAPRLSTATTWMQRRPRMAIAVTGILAVAVQMHPVVFFGKSFVSPNNGSLMLYGEQPSVPGATQTIWCDGMGSDVGAMLFQHIYYPMIQRESLFAHRELPLWNRYCLSGEPLLGQGQTMFGDPFNVLTILTDGASWAWDIRFAIAHWLLAAGLGFIVLRLTRHLGAAVLVTIGGAFIGFFTFRVNHPATFSLCYSPWILWAWLGLIEADTAKARAKWFAALVITNAVVMTSGTVKEAYMTMVCLNLAGVVWIARLPATAGRRWKLSAIAIGAGAIFVLLMAPLWISFLAALRHSVTGYDTPTANPLPLAQFIGFFDDIFYRQNLPGENVLGPSLNAFLMLGVLWWLVHPGRWKSDPAAASLAIAALVPLALGFGIVPPAVIVKIPFLANLVHVGNVFSCPLIIVAALLAGCGMRDAITRVREPGWLASYARMIGFVAVLATAYFLVTRGQTKSSFFRGYISSLGVAVLALPLGVWWARRRAQPGLLYVVLLLGLPLLLWRHGQYLSTPFNHYAWTPGDRVNIHATSPAVTFIDQLQRKPGRVVGFQTNLFPSYNAALRWESLYGVDALRSWYYHSLASAFNLERVWLWDRSVPEETMPLQLRGYDMLNVTHYVADHSERPRTIFGLQLLAQRDLDVYTSPTAWPRAFFTNRLAVYVTPEEFALHVLNGDGRPFAAVQAGEDKAPTLSGDLRGREMRPATDFRLTGNTTTFVVDASGPGIAVLTETFYPEDFRVTVNGKPAHYFRANHSFKGVGIERAGRHTITFAYWPQHFTLALWLGAAGLGLFVTTYLWLRREPRSV